MLLFLPLPGKGGQSRGYSFVLTERITNLKSPTEINQPKVVKLDTTGSPPIGKEALLFSLL